MKWKNFETKTHRCIVNLKNGVIIGYEHKAQHRKFEGNIIDEINLFPHTEKDFILIKAKQVIQ